MYRFFHSRNYRLLFFSSALDCHLIASYVTLKRKSLLSLSKNLTNARGRCNGSRVKSLNSSFTCIIILINDLIKKFKWTSLKYRVYYLSEHFRLNRDDISKLVLIKSELNILEIQGRLKILCLNYLLYFLADGALL